MRAAKNISILEFSKWASGVSRFCVIVSDEDRPSSAVMRMKFEHIEIREFFPTSVVFSGSAGYLDLRCVTSIDSLSKDSFLFHCGYQNLPETYSEFLVKSV